jgi:hypothetical protein
MRFKGTLILFVICLLLGCYMYFYEIKGGEQRTKAKEAENQVWKFESNTIRQIDLSSSNLLISAVRQSDKDWILTSPKKYDADSDELNRLAGSASNIRRETVVDPNAPDLARFGLSPARASLKVKTGDGKQYAIDFGTNNPTGSSAYAAIPGKREVFLVSTAVVSAFEKKTDDLRNHRILGFDQPEVQTLDLSSSKGDLQLTKDSNDRWWIGGKETVAADSPGIRAVLNALSMGQIKAFFNDAPEEYKNLSFDRPTVDVRLTYGKNKALKHLVIGPAKSGLLKKNQSGADKSHPDGSPAELYLAKDESRPDLFFVDKETVDKLVKTRNEVRDKALASVQRWDVDSISLTNTKGAISFSKSNGEWFVSGTKSKAKWEGVNGILDAMEKPVKEWIDNPSSLSKYGLDKPSIRVILKQGSTVLADCSIGKAAKEGLYAQVKGDSSVKVADPDGLSALDMGQKDLVVEPPAVPVPPSKK